MQSSARIGVLLMLTACGSSSEPPVITVISVPVAVDASVVTGALQPLWRDHYDLSYTHMDYADEPGFTALVDDLAPRSWRCSVGRWEVGFQPPAGGDSLDPAVLQMVDREYYRGPATMLGADDPANYDFTYLDLQLTELTARGAAPFLCFDSMPFTLSSEQDPMNANNFNLTAPGTPWAQYSYSNGIRTAPPSDNAVYARIVRNTVRHVRGLFAGTTDFGVEYVEVGNEPDLLDGFGVPFPLFWTGDRAQFLAMYQAIAAEVDMDAQISGLVKLGAGSFAYQPHEMPPRFLDDFLAGVALATTRLDFISYHSYGDDPTQHLARVAGLDAVLSFLGLTPERINAEWGRALDGLDPVYDTIEHGLFRAKVIGYMAIFGVAIAHEALVRDPGSGAGQLGLLTTGPPTHKPASHVYQGLGLLDATPEALAVNAPAGVLVFAARDAGGTRVVVAAAVDDPGAGQATAFELSISNLPFGPAGCDVTRSRVTDASGGVELVSTDTLLGATLDETLDVAAGQAGLYVWELVAN